MEKKDNFLYSSTEKNSQEEKDLYGIKPEVSLQSVNFATTENPLLNEQIGEEQ